MKRVRPKKNLGQHFLTDLNVAKRIADTVDACPDIPVLEIGPGMGVLTQYLLPKPREVKVVEIDRESVAYLHEMYSKNEVNFSRCEVRGTRCEDSLMAGEKAGETVVDTTENMVDDTNLAPRTSHLVPRGVTSHDWIISADFLRMDLHTVFDGRPFVLTGNYPYDISSQIFFKMLDNKELIPCCTGMIQREVALRMAAEPGNKQYGILSVLMQAWYDVEYLFTVDENVFNPPPKVKSAVIRMTRNGVTDLGCDWMLFKRLVKTVFNQRRKMLRVSLRQMFPNGQPQEGFYDQAMMTLRPEQLTIPQFVELTNLVAAELQTADVPTANP